MGIRHVHVLAFILILLAACTIPPPSSKVQLKNDTVVIPDEVAQVIDAPIMAPEPVIESESARAIVADEAELEAMLRTFAQGLQRNNATILYPLLYSEVHERITEDGLQRLMVYFKPKDRMEYLFKDVRHTNDGYEGVLLGGTHDIGLLPFTVPFVQEDGMWKIRWFDTLISSDEVLAACQEKLVAGDDDAPEASVAKAMSASSCITVAAHVLNDESLCPYAVYDRDHCFRNLGIILTKTEKISLCQDPSGVTDNVTIATCLWNLAEDEGDVEICRSIEKNRAERYFCIGELAAPLRQPYQCNDAINDYTMRLCLEHYVHERGTSSDVCANPLWARLIDC